LHKEGVFNDYASYKGRASVVLAVGVVQIGVDAGNVDNFAGVVLKGHIDDGLKDALHFLGDVLVAGLAWSQAESTALGRAFGAASPADWANAISFLGAIWVTQRSAFD